MNDAARKSQTSPVLPPEAQILWTELAASESPIVVDVRSPQEFARDHIPGSVSCALFGNAEVVVLGTLYRMEGEARAREWGVDQLSPRLQEYTAQLLRAFELEPVEKPVVDDRRPRVITCARGGQRSEAVTRHLRRLGYPVLRLVDGYRSYRSWVREQLRTLELTRPIVLNGLTGCGKTLVLREIDRLRPGRVIDLEGLAGHRSSVLGDIGLRPVTQKQFEARLVDTLRRLQPGWCLIEWEARRIGNREIPAALYHALRSAPQIELRATLAQRVQILADEYLECDGVEAVIERLPALAAYPAFGREGVERLTAQLREGRVAEVVEALLTLHYDPRYQHGNRELDLVKIIELSSVERTAGEIVEWIEDWA